MIFLLLAPLFILIGAAPIDPKEGLKFECLLTKQFDYFNTQVSFLQKIETNPIHEQAFITNNSYRLTGVFSIGIREIKDMPPNIARAVYDISSELQTRIDGLDSSDAVEFVTKVRNIVVKNNGTFTIRRAVEAHIYLTLEWEDLSEEDKREIQEEFPNLYERMLESMKYVDYLKEKYPIQYRGEESPDGRDITKECAALETDSS